MSSLMMQSLLSSILTMQVTNAKLVVGWLFTWDILQTPNIASVRSSQENPHYYGYYKYKVIYFKNMKGLVKQQ